MAKATIIFVRNEKTGKRDIQIEYQSDLSAMPYEHEEEHRRLVGQLIDLEEVNEEIEVSREEEEQREELPQQTQKPLRQTQTLTHGRGKR